RSARLREALARFDEATITTIHGFCQQALAQSGLRAGSDQGVELVEDTSDLIAEVCRDALIDRLSDDPLALSTDGNDCPPPVDGRGVRPPGKVEGYIASTVKAVLANPAARVEPGPDAGGIAGTWAHVVGDVVREVGDRQRARRQIGYDRLVTDLRDLLVDPHSGPQLAEQLAGRYRLVLVDEFQDTDRVQWDVFSRAFAGTGTTNRLVTVGDPKQAIYRFRGADVHAYLDTVERSDRSTLGVNHRSDQQLLDALAVLFDGATLGHDAIKFSRVGAAPDAPHNAMGREPALHIRVVPDDESIPVTRYGLEAGAVQRIVLTDTAARIRTLLDEGTITGPGLSGEGGSTRQVEPQDIAVLVPSQRRAAETAAVLRDWGIPSVRARTGSVLDSDAAVQWRLLLAGLATPTRARVARGAGLGWFFDHDPAQLTDQHDADPRNADVGAFETPMAELQRTLAVLADRLRTRGVGAFYEQMRSESVVLRVVLSRPNGDRNLTDLDHIAALLVSATRGGSTAPAGVQQALDSMMAAGDHSEATMRRIETDADAVHITTIHSAKGLEYPIVLVPFAYVERPMLGRPYVFNDNGQRVIDVASWVAWAADGTEGGGAGKKARDERKSLARDEIDGDGLRLLYVALTRAKHRVEVWWAPMKNAATSAFGRLLLDRVGSGPLQNSPITSPFEKLGNDVNATRSQIDAIVTASNGTIGVFDVPLEQPIRRPLPVSVTGATPLVLADASSRQPLGDDSWRSWSFTAITRSLDHAGHGSPFGVAGGVESVPVGGADEPSADVDGEIPDPKPLASVHRRANVAMPLADTVGGTTFGVM
ncbi:MAG: UvrD-helicase domain-containing protein, partial [Actinomycetota bacterium]|nr:UvrD-helicase domain-containing protein [Actinomycetota bacterium]